MRHIGKEPELTGTSDTTHDVTIGTAGPFSLAVSAAPAAWGGTTSPARAIVRRGVAVAESGTHGPAWTHVRQIGFAQVRLRCNLADGIEEGWLDRIFRPHDEPMGWNDPVVAKLAARFPGLRSFTDGSLYLGLVTSIIGQSISIASAMAAQRRLASSFGEGVEVLGQRLVPLPTAAVLADAPVEMIRASGVTWKRAEALKAIAREAADGNLPVPGAMPDGELARALRELPLVGPWTASSALLWGIGAPDAFPSGDVALLRAARLAYDDPGMTMRELDALAEAWRPWRGIATRLLWTNLLGPAWRDNDEDLDDPTNDEGNTGHAS